MSDLIIFQDGQPGKSRVPLLREAAERHEGGRLRVQVAWASGSGTYHFLEEVVGERLSDLQVVVGGNGGLTELDAVLRLRDAGARVWVAYFNEDNLVHPKTYWFDGGSAAAQAVTGFSGSANMTNGGLYTNHEHLLGFTVDGDTRAFASTAIASFEATWAGVTQPGNPYVHPADTDEAIRALYQQGLLTSQRAARRRRQEERAAGGQGGHLSQRTVMTPVRAPQVAGFAPVPVPFELDAEPPAAEAAQPGSVASGNVAAPAGPMFYVRELTVNDVRKLLGQQVGTFEPDLGVVPRDLEQAFWGWPDRYEEVIRRQPRDEFTARATLVTALTPGVEIGFRLWFRPTRPDHAAEHRMTPLRGPDGANIRDYVPSDFDDRGLLVVEESDGDVDYVVRLVSSDDADYATYAAFLVHQNPRHRYGYGRLPGGPATAA